MKLWRRYVDDTFVIIASERIDEFHNHLNSINNNIQFTIEKENDNSIAFLDVKITKTENGDIFTNVYRKPTHTDQYLNFKSYQPIQHKAAVVRTLSHRARVIPTKPEDQLTEL